MSTGEQDDDRERSKKSRSPNYPAVGLETAVKWTRALYDAEKKNPAPPVIVAQHCGYKAGPSGLSGPARSAVSALKKYGLVTETQDNRLRVSDDAVKLFLHPDEDGRQKLLQSMAMRPGIMGEILASYPEGPPSDESLKYHLVTQMNFAEDGANIFVRVFRETYGFAKLDPSSYSAVEMPPHIPAAERAPTHGNQSVSSSSAARPSGGFTVRYELSDGNVVNLDPSKPLTEATFEELLEYLGVYRKILAKRSRTVADPDAS